MCDTAVTELITDALICAGAVLSACEQPNTRRGPMLFVRAMAELCRKLDQASEWGSPQQIDGKLQRFVGICPTIPELAPGRRAESKHVGMQLRIGQAVHRPRCSMDEFRRHHVAGDAISILTPSADARLHLRLDLAHRFINGTPVSTSQ